MSRWYRRSTGAVVLALLAALLPAMAGPASAAATTLTPGSSATLTISTPGEVVSATFAGATGQRPLLRFGDSTLAHPATVALVRPNGSTASAQTLVPAIGVHPFSALDATGTWTLRLTPGPADTGVVDVGLSFLAAPIGPLTVGKPTTLTVPTPGLVRVYSVTVPAGRRATMTETSAAWTSSMGGVGLADLELFRPDGTLWGIFGSDAAGPDNWSEIRPGPGLPLGTAPAGVWTLVAGGRGDAVGGEVFTLGLVADQVKPVVSGQTSHTAVSVRGQQVRYTFTGAVGQRPGIRLTARSWRSPGFLAADSEVLLYRPDGTYYDGATSLTTPVPMTDWYDLKPLDVAGTWTLAIDPDQDTVGSETMGFFLARDEPATALARNVTIPVAITTPGATKSFTFPAKRGQRVVLSVNRAWFTSVLNGGGAGSGRPYARLFGPDGTEAHGSDPFTLLPARGSQVVDLLLAPTVSGTWTLRIDPDQDTVGSMTMKLWTVTDQVLPPTFGTPLPVRLTQVAQQARLAFADTTGPTLKLAISGSTFTDVTIRLYDAHWASWAEVPITAPGDYTLNLGALWFGGPYIVAVDPGGKTTGSMTLTATLVPAPPSPFATPL